MNEGITVLHAIYALGGGGAEAQLRLLVRHSSARVRHVVFCIDDRGAEKYPETSRVEIIAHRRRGLLDWRIVTALARAMRSRRPVCVHVWLPPVVTIPAMVVAWVCGIPAIYSYRNRMRFYRPLVVVEWATALMCASRVIANNPVEQSHRWFRYLYRRKCGVTIPNGIDVKALTVKTRYRDRDGTPFRMLYMGRLVAQKNILGLVQALARLDRDMPWGLEVYGDGDQEATAREAVKAAGLCGKVGFHPFDADIHARMHQFDVLVFPSVHEGMPNVLVEALAIGIPVIASRILANLRAIGDDDVVEWIDPHRPEDIVAAIGRYHRDPERFNRRVARGRALAASFSPDTMAGRYVDQYMDIAGCRGADPCAF